MSLVGVNTKIVKNGDAEPILAAGKFRIYSMRFCPWAQRSLIYAAAKKIPTEIVNIDLKNKPDWYFSKHFKGQVPALEYDGKHVIESAVIPEYLDDIFPETRILPTDPYQKVQQKLLLARLSEIAPAFYGVVQSVQDPSVREEKVANLLKSLEAAEQLLTGEYYSGTNKPGYADYLFYPNIQRVFWLSNALPGLPLDVAAFPGNAKFPKLTSWFSRIAALPEVIEASQPTETGVGFFKDYVNGSPNYDFGL
ncbi:unnamed protein product [Caenorhabditis angaria]|uniref:Glutathione S-transferase omega n=1 Tax=Caenorhabditis angaria TaxID=860376 RepID=A0A9P1IIV8_9PELO|nr:unnamed protein product [Caenorhabditis angaria]